MPNVAKDGELGPAGCRPVGAEELQFRAVGMGPDPELDSNPSSKNIQSLDDLKLSFLKVILFSAEYKVFLASC